MPTFDLYRLRLRPDERSNLFDDGKTPSQVLQIAIMQKPSTLVREQTEWHIGNVTSLSNDDMRLYFRFGKKTRKKKPQFNEETKDFADYEDTEAPYTHILIDCSLELCGIARNYSLSQRQRSISQNLVASINSARVMETVSGFFEISRIADAADFFRSIQEAIKISEFGFTYRRPNPFDSDELVRALEEGTLRLGANEGKTVMRAESQQTLNKEEVERLARSAAASGDNAFARIRGKGESNTSKRILLEETPASLDFEGDMTNQKDQAEVIQEIVRAYRRIRG